MKTKIALFVGSCWLYFYTKHWIIGVVLFVLFLLDLIPVKTCSGCPECDPQLYMDENGEIDPGMYNPPRR
ncbi:MAG: hypothetical protein KGI60_03965 [Patescibacteria group bacterium]|nr:hypothetical protein [Patescibacteria group bacterium]